MELLADFNEFDEEDELDLERDILGRVRREYFERIHPFERYRERKFQARYRLSRNLAACLADEFGRSQYATSGRSMGGGLSHRDRFCLALRYYATGAFFGPIGDTQGVHKCTVSRAVRDVTNYLYSMRDTYINFPNREEFPVYAQDFAQLYGFPCVIGCLDGTHICLQAPKEDERAFVDRHWHHSINMMAVCDAFLRFTYVDTRFPGSSHDAYVLRRSLIGLQGEERTFRGYWFLGDSGYPLKSYLMTPVLHAHTQAERAYNRSQKLTRAVIEMAFGVLKRRFRCLDDSGGVLLADPVPASKIIMACTILHNICVQQNIPIRRDPDWDALQRPRRRRARNRPDIIPPRPEDLENQDPPGAVVRRRLIETRFND